MAFSNTKYMTIKTKLLYKIFRIIKFFISKYTQYENFLHLTNTKWGMAISTIGNAFNNV